METQIGSSESIKKMRSNINTLDERTRNYAMAHPFVALFAAVTAGYMIGRVVTRM